MKKMRICLEINGLAEDENGNPCPGGVCLTLGGDCEEELTGEEYQRIMEQIDIQGVLRFTCLDEMYSADDCRLISPEEYDRKYRGKKWRCEQSYGDIKSHCLPE